MTSPNPHVPDEHRMNNVITKASVGYGYVLSVVEDKNQVEIQPIGDPDSFTVSAMVTADGDAVLPDRTDDQSLLALYARIDGSVPVVLGYYYDIEENEIPSIQRGERKIGHGSSNSVIYFEKDGTVTVTSDGGAEVSLNADGSVSINGGTKGAIYDIDTTKDADGHVTSISLQRRSDVLL